MNERASNGLPSLPSLSLSLLWIDTCVLKAGALLKKEKVMTENGTEWSQYSSSSDKKGNANPPLQSKAS